MPCHTFGDRDLPNVDAKLEDFAMDPASAPQRVGEAHGADQLPDFERHLRSAAATSRLLQPHRRYAAEKRSRFIDDRSVSAAIKPELHATTRPMERARLERSKVDCKNFRIASTRTIPKDLGHFEGRRSQADEFPANRVVRERHFYAPAFRGFGRVLLCFGFVVLVATGPDFFLAEVESLAADAASTFLLATASRAASAPSSKPRRKTLSSGAIRSRIPSRILLHKKSHMQIYRAPN